MVPADPHVFKAEVFSGSGLLKLEDQLIRVISYKCKKQKFTKGKNCKIPTAVQPCDIIHAYFN